MKDFLQLKKNNKKDFTGLKPVRVALLGDTPTQFLAQAIRGTGYDHGIDLQIWEADFNQVERQVFDAGSDLYQFDPAIVIIFHATHKLLEKYNKLHSTQHGNLADDQLALIGDLHTEITSRLNPIIIYYNYPEINDSVYGNHANKVRASFLFQLRKLNYELMLYAEKKPDFYLCDISTIQNQVGKNNFFRSSLYVHSEMVVTLDCIPEIAARSVDLITAFYGNFKKCLVLDLDNTLWGGIIGDDGIENIQLGNLGIGKAFTELQYWIKKLKNRGIILAVCSKNTESVVKEVFVNHPDMVLRSEDIAVFAVNWENKADNIRQIQKALNIGFDSMIFLDDNPFERNLVRENIPAISVPELPEDPAEYLEYLYSLNLFETVSSSSEDMGRTELYQTAFKRADTQKQSKSEEEFLQGLDMRSIVQSFNEFNTPRAAQLSQRSNQFNLRTIRYTETDIKRIAGSQDSFGITFTLEDKFGDNGLVVVVVLHTEDADTLFIENWFMSCRVLSRTMENFTLNIIIDFAAAKGFHFLKGEYIPTLKNEMVKDHYHKLGFKESGMCWLLDVQTYMPGKTHISLKA